MSSILTVSQLNRYISFKLKKILSFVVYLSEEKYRVLQIIIKPGISILL